MDENNIKKTTMYSKGEKVVLLTIESFAFHFHPLVLTSSGSKGFKVKLLYLSLLPRPPGGFFRPKRTLLRKNYQLNGLFSLTDSF